MATAYKVLAQAAPAATTETTLYTTPASTSTIVSTIAVSCMIIGPLWTVILLVAPGAVCWTNISLCNIACHWGKKDALIKQNTILAWITFGEGYHRHHHDSPTDPNFGQGKIDPGYIAIKLILIHELAHIIRNDYLVNLFIKISKILLPI